ncbi:hypothetical protein RIR_jg27655.t1 [Rhizophagus irregularis DAOM 181602=DAOM 197198]|nr:hypothetical protein RIR_jg27655.t1 [Rhizophagus irregularis DAOM 181602=DAOM 197198]
MSMICHNIQNKLRTSYKKKNFINLPILNNEDIRYFVTNVKKGFYKGIDNIFSETTSRSEDFDSLANNTALNSETVELLLKISARRTGKILGTPT